MRSVKRLGLILVVAAAAELAVWTFPLSSAPRQTDRASLVKEAVPIDFGAPYAANAYAFLNGGRFLDVAPLSVHELPAVNKVGVERLLASVGEPSYFINLLTLPTDDASAGWLVHRDGTDHGGVSSIASLLPVHSEERDAEFAGKSE